MFISINYDNPKYLKLQKKIFNLTLKILNNFLNKCDYYYESDSDKIKNKIENDSIFIISINKRLKNIYGQSIDCLEKNKYKHYNIEYSYDLLKNLKIKQLKLIVIHELAHSIDCIIRGPFQPFHDKHWKKIVNILGGQPSMFIDINKI